MVRASRAAPAGSWYGKGYTPAPCSQATVTVVEKESTSTTTTSDARASVAVRASAPEIPQSVRTRAGRWSKAGDVFATNAS
jgi:hypothetical protein